MLKYSHKFTGYVPYACFARVSKYFSQVDEIYYYNLNPLNIDQYQYQLSTMIALFYLLNYNQSDRESDQPKFNSVGLCNGVNTSLNWR
jgi:hypothetical protein